MAVNIKRMVDAYVECALWTEGLHDKSFANIDPVSLDNIRETCEAFAAMPGVAEIIEGNERHAGHDFWLTRNGHGAGFWNGSWYKIDGELLARAAQSFGEHYAAPGELGEVNFDPFYHP